MSKKAEKSMREPDLGNQRRPRMVVAGPSSDVTIPGVMVTEVVGALLAHSEILRVAVNRGKHSDAGLDRAKSLAANSQRSSDQVKLLGTSIAKWQLRHRFNEFFEENVAIGIALAWPGIDCSWIGDFVIAANTSGAQSVVLVVSHPTAVQRTSLAHEVTNADLVLVGDVMDATLLSAALGKQRPMIEIHRSLSLTGREIVAATKTISTFLPKDDEKSLLTVLAAFDATPSAWVKDYDLRVIMRYSGRTVPDYVNASYHSDRVQLIGEDFSSQDLRRVASDSSAVSVANPALESRIFSAAMDEGVATVVLAGAAGTEVGHGYVGGLIADVERPTSVYVAHNHAIRLSELKFPSPGAWFDLAARLSSMLSDKPNELVKVPTV